MGEGKLSLGATFQSSNYDRLDDSVVDNNLQVRSVTGSTPSASRSGTTSLALTSRTTVLFARMGVIENLKVWLMGFLASRRAHWVDP